MAAMLVKVGDTVRYHTSGGMVDAKVTGVNKDGKSVNLSYELARAQQTASNVQRGQSDGQWEMKD